jgi:hypothetical protein
MAKQILMNGRRRCLWDEYVVLVKPKAKPKSEARMEEKQLSQVAKPPAAWVGVVAAGSWGHYGGKVRLFY